jgi:hypothetical protein
MATATSGLSPSVTSISGGVFGGEKSRGGTAESEIMKIDLANK